MTNRIQLILNSLSKLFCRNNPTPAVPNDEAESKQVWIDIDSSWYYLFVDIDGVLHRAENGSFEFMPLLEELLLRNPQTGIFLSTNWRIGMSKPDLLALFPTSIHSRIAGCTPDLDGEVAEHVRWHECMAVVHFFNLTRYSFIDDTARLFPDDAENLFLTKRHEGLNAARVKDLEVLIRHVES